ncbi:D-Ala-D-Ala carboxypeptidase family metallohydrolase [Ensifer adhaerens]|uniref:D-Ala-D-Ala carboxypeptidase family metallohydrolase n=1 Tax=Ensifer adhaerens TaxID=106592 RepID=UPI0023A916B8|nr:D-Ala-D-Ala carboxypeptidase family metallohydrolase [Ensifer adhaerens]WDZ78245.1 D-Ala-D-Ala carboxypeptidase family metallohydrolase [Ensifer adhaerens]
MQHPGTKGAVLAAIARAAALSVSLLALSGCVSAVADNDVTTGLDLEGQTAAQAAQSAGQGPVRDAQVAAMGSDPQAQQAATAQDPTQAQSLTMQTTGLRAASSSIYGQAVATQGTPNTQPQANGAVPLPAGQPAMNATTNSLFSGTQRQPRPIMTPQQGAAKETTAQPADTAVTAYAPTPAPDAVPVPLSAEAATGSENSAALQAVANAEVAPAATEVAIAGPMQATAEAKESNGDQEAPKTWTLATLFAGKRKEKQQEALRAAQPAEKKTITTSNASQPQTASLAYTLPGVKLNSLYNFEHEEHLGDDDDSAPVQVASLSGLARLAPSGLILQTEKVDAGCFKPELMQMLKKVESHYGKQVMVTSGLRPIKVNRAKQSLHTRCEAADIQVQGVSKWDLAEFLRSVPGRGGVGTYCHTESVHIDIGTQRDWNWRCRRGKG